MPERTTRTVEGHEIVTSGSLICPSPDLCDVTPDGIRAPSSGRKFERYVRRHCRDHNLGKFESLDDAMRNLGLWCFYFFHKYIWGNEELCPIPFWEVHAFVVEDEWNADDLAESVHLLPPASERREGEHRRMKQAELPRQCEKTSIVARAHTVFEHMHEYFINDRANFRTIVRSATGKNTRDTLAIVRRMSTKSQAIMRLYGIWLVRCDACLTSFQVPTRATACPTCASARIRCKRISLINDSRGAGAFALDAISFRWLTDLEDADAVAAYSVWVAGLETETVGQRPDRYKWDDPQTDKNARTVLMRAKIIERFDDSVRQLQFGGELLVCDTRKFVDDFAGKIRQEPLKSLFFSLHRKVRWTTDEPENPPYVVNGYRYYFPIKGNGDRALDEDEVNRLERQMSERNFSAEYMNDPLDPSKALFKREHFKLITAADAPIEVRYGLGCDVSPRQEQELRGLGLSIVAYNSCDPAGKEEQSKRGDDTFIVGVRLDRYGSVYVTLLRAGKWTASRTWDEIDSANSYNRPQFTDYEMPADEKHVRPSFDKWVRERSEALSAIGEKPTVQMIPMRWSHMPKSGKFQRIEQMEQWTKNGRFFILTNAAEYDLIEKYLSQWVGYLVSDHDDGPDATSRLIRWLITHTYQQPRAEDIGPQVTNNADGSASVPISLIKELSITSTEPRHWGETGW